MDQSGLFQLMPFVLIFVVMYFLVIRPQSKKQKELEKMRNALKSGDEVIVAGGIHGKVAGIEADGKIVKVKVDSGTSLRVDKSSITMLALKQ